MNQTKKLDAIYDAIVGTELNPNGLIQRMEKVEKDNANTKKLRWTIAGAATIITAIFKLT